MAQSLKYEYHCNEILASMFVKSNGEVKQKRRTLMPERISKPGKRRSKLIKRVINVALDVYDIKSSIHIS